MGQESQSAFAIFHIKVEDSDKLTLLFASFWNYEGLNSLNFLWYGHNPVTSDVITQVVKFVGSKE